MIRTSSLAVVLAAFAAACTGDAEPDATAEAVPAAEQAPARPTSPDVFVTEPGAGATVMFVGRERPQSLADGVIYVPLSTFSVERDGIPNEFPPADSLVALLRAAGVGGDRFVILGEPIAAGRAYAGLDYLGLGDRAALLEGPLPATFSATPPTRAAPLNVNVRTDMIVDADWVHGHLDDADVVILDARPPAEFSGETPGEGITRPGHIPGARNLFWQDLVQSQDPLQLKPEAELRRLFEEAGARPGSTIVSYCRTGGQASFLYAVARSLGHDVKLYDGSFVDWSRTTHPVER